ncbi:ATP-binding protein [Candidatus Saccharibacteria bacterium]|nr:ATP-binding protein [Candidatus Saccharibacteria bacterium]
MDLLKRNYLDEMISVSKAPDIKVITGVRRSGKSVLLEAFRDYLLQNEANVNIIYIKLTSFDFEQLLEYHALYQYAEEHYMSGKVNYLMIDEVQMCEGFELAINSLYDTKKYNIYLTGSNAFLLSSDLATLFTGRTYSIEVFPFSYKEYKEYYDMVGREVNFEDYVMEGGLAGSYAYDTMEQKYNYIGDIYDTLIMRDIQKKYNIKNTALLEAVSDFMLSNISKQTSIRNIADTLNSKTGESHHSTVGMYVEYLCRAYAFYKVRRYDITGKQYLASQDKYFLSDHVFKFAKLGTRIPDYGKVYENIVAIELLRRGYEIYVGTLRGAEVDFVAKKRDEKFYVQVSYDISEPATFAREVKSLLAINDAYPKILLARTRHPEYLHEGIRVVDIADWLME